MPRTVACSPCFRATKKVTGWIPLVDATRSCFSFTGRYSPEGSRSVVLADLEVVDDGTMIPKDVELEFTPALHVAGESYREIAVTAPDRDEAIRRAMDRLQTFPVWTWSR